MNNHGPGPNLMKRTLRATRKRKPTRLEVFSLGLGVWMGCSTEVLRTGSVISDPGSCVTGFGFGGVGGAWCITADHLGLQSASFTGGLPLRGEPCKPKKTKKKKNPPGDIGGSYHESFVGCPSQSSVTETSCVMRWYSREFAGRGGGGGGEGEGRGEEKEGTATGRSKGGRGKVQVAKGKGKGQGKGRHKAVLETRGRQGLRGVFAGEWRGGGRGGGAAGSREDRGMQALGKPGVAGEKGVVMGEAEGEEEEEQEEEQEEEEEDEDEEEEEGGEREQEKERDS